MAQGTEGGTGQRRSRRGRFAGALLTGALTLYGSTASADARTEARRHFRHGMELIVGGDVDGGVAELQAAYDILPHPNVLYNIGRAYAEVGRYEEARDYFEQYLESDPPDREEVRAIVAAIDTRIAARDEVAAVEPEPTPVEQVTVTDDPGVAASAEQLAMLDGALEQVAGLCRITGSTALCDREQELRGLRERLAAGDSPPVAAEVPPTEAIAVAEGEPESAGRLELGDAAGDAAYVERVDAAARRRTSPLDAPASTTIITRQDIRMSGVTSIGELLRRAAGVHVASTTPGVPNVDIRGFNRLLSPRVLMLINGRTTYFDPLGTPIWDSQTIQVEDIERIEVIRGPASVLYGANGFSGIVNIVLRTPGEDEGVEVQFGVGNADQARGHASASGRRGDFAYRFAVGYQQYDRYSRLYPEERADLDVGAAHPERAYQSTVANGQVRYRPTDDLTLTFEGGMNYAHVMNFYATGAFLDFYANGPVSYASMSVSHPWVRGRVFLNRANFDVQVTDGSLVGGTYLNNTVDVEGELTRQFHLGFDHDVHLGVNYRRKQVDWTFLGPVYNEDHYAVFFEDTMRVVERLRLVAAVRMDRHPLLPTPVFTPRGAVIVRPTENQSIRLTAGTAFRTPSMMDTYVQLLLNAPVAAVGAYGIGSDVARRDLGRPAVDPERIVSAEVGYQNQESDYVSFDVSAYYNRVLDLIAFQNDTSLFTLADYANGTGGLPGFDRTRNRFVAGYASLTNEPERYDAVGGEVSIRTYPADGLDVYANYAFSYVMVHDSPLGLDVDHRHPQHMLNVGVQYRAPFGLEVAVDYHYSASTIWPELATSLSGLVRVQAPNPDFSLLNARIAYTTPGDRFTVGVAGTNLLFQSRTQHPLGQPVDTRVLGTVSARF